MKWPLLALLALALLAAGCGKEQRQPQRVAGVEDQVMDDALFLYGDADAAAAELRSLGVDRVRVTAGWRLIAPASKSVHRPDFDATDPDDYPDGAWDDLDRAVKAIVDHDLQPMLDVSFWAPRWAVQRDTGGPDNFRWKPDPAEFGEFAEAVARRYPQVHLWTTWNEPNNASFLLPQWERRGREWFPVSPHWYRRMHEQAYAAIKRVSSRNEVLIGGLTSFGADRPGTYRTIPPLRFLRELACVDRSLRPLGVADCRGFRPLRADGFSIHPYMHRHPPTYHFPDPDSVGISDLGRLSSLLDRLNRAGRIEQRLPIYVTEFGYETNPPDPARGVSLARQAAYLNESAAILYRRGDVRMLSQFQLRDPEPDRLYQTGLRLPDGRPKPSLFGWPLPFWIDGREATGRVRQGAGRHAVRLERLESGVWRPAGKAFTTGPDGMVRRRVGRAGVYRLRWGKKASFAVRAR